MVINNEDDSNEMIPPPHDSNDLDIPKASLHQTYFSSWLLSCCLLSGELCILCFVKYHKFIVQDFIFETLQCPGTRVENRKTLDV